MTTLDIIALCLRYGEKVHIYLNPDKTGKRVDTDAFFTGFRHYGKGIIRSFDSLYPVFHSVRKDGTMSSKLLGGMDAWSPLSIASITKLENIEMNAEVVPALVELQYNLQKGSHDALIGIMKHYAQMHPGRPKVWFSEDDGVSATLEAKYCSYSGTIYAVSIIDGKIHYDISTEMDYQRDVPDYRDVSRCGVFVEDELYLLKVVLNTIKDYSEPCEYDPLKEEFYKFIKPGARVRYSNNDPEIRAYQKKMDLPGPIVTIVKVNTEEDGVIECSTEVEIRTEGENPRTFIADACDLEPLAEGE